jgi:hypothetical protein
MTEINHALLTQLAGSPHPLLNPLVCDCHNWCGEINQEAKVSHHLLDFAEIPHGTGYAQNLDARTFQAVMKLNQALDRLDRIAGWHARMTGPTGTFDSYCTECGMRWPCDTRRMADGTHEDLA